MVLEILISTMNRTSLDFLETMFPFETIEELNILVINQTIQGSELKSKFANLRVINSYEKGLSKSRNLATDNAIGDICLISDDDIVYVKGFQEVIKTAFEKYKNASLIKFKIETFKGNVYKTYPKKSQWLNTYSDINPISSIEIAFIRYDITSNKIRFNELFGLGSTFKSGEESLFLYDILKSDLKIFFKNEVIVKHSYKSSTVIGSDDYIKVQSVIYFMVYGKISKFYIFKLLFFLLRRKHIKATDLKRKYFIAKKAIRHYKQL